MKRLQNHSIQMSELLHVCLKQPQTPALWVMHILFRKGSNSILNKSKRNRTVQRELITKRRAKIKKIAESGKFPNYCPGTKNDGANEKTENLQQLCLVESLYQNDEGNKRLYPHLCFLKQSLPSRSDFRKLCNDCPAEH